jgi:hypothetical protein
LIKFLHSDFLIDECKVSNIGNFEIIKQKHVLKLHHPYGNLTIKDFRGTVNCARSYYQFVKKDNNKIMIDLDGIELLLTEKHEKKKKKEIDKNAANLAKMILMAFIESKLEDVEYSKQFGELYVSYKILNINHELYFCWKHYDELIKQEADNLIFKTSMWGKEIKFSNYYSKIQRVRQLQVDKNEINVRTTTFNSQFWNFNKDVFKN